MWYWILGLLAAGYVYWDARRRGNQVWAWALGTFLGWPIIIPIYRSKRYLLAGERRSGGTAWHLAKVFVIVWQFLCLAWLISYWVDISRMPAGSEWEEAGAALGGMMGTGFIIGIWVGITVITGIIGLFLKSNFTEEGPTGPNVRKLKPDDEFDKEYDRLKAEWKEEQAEDC